MKWFRRWISVVTLLSMLLSASVVGQSRVPAGVSAQHFAALTTAADYLSASRADRASAMLKRLGYEVPVDDGIWMQMPTIRKLEMGYAAALRGDPVRGGERYLALLASDLARQYESVSRSELKPFISSTPPMVTFAQNIKEPAVVRSASHRAAIRAAADYCTVGPAQHKVLISDFALSVDEAHRILSTSRTVEDAFLTAFNRVATPERNAALTRVVDRLSKSYEAARYEPAFEPYRQRSTEAMAALFPPHEGLGGSPSSGPGGAPPDRPRPRGPRPTPPPRSGNPSARYYSFVQENYAGKPRGFRSVARVAAGFGGVVFGNDVGSTLRAANPRSLKFVLTAAGRGVVETRYADGSKANFGPLPTEFIRTAHDIVYRGIGRISNEPDAAIGIVSLGTQVDYTECVDGNLQLGSAWEVVLHPALVDRDIGWAAVLADSLLIDRDALLKALPASASIERRELRRLFRAMDEREVFNWKIVDVPLTFDREGEHIVVSRTASGDYPAGLRKVALLEVRPFFDETREDYDEEFANEFYGVMPDLLKHRDYAKINGLAAAVAFFRWAKRNGAAWVGPVPAVSEIRTPDAIALVDGRIKPIALPIQTIDLAAAMKCGAEDSR